MSLLDIPDICLFSSTDITFGSSFLHIKRVNRDKKFLTIKRKLPKNWVYNATKHHKLYSSFLHITDFLHISHVKSFFHMTICHMENRSTWNKWRISPHDKKVLHRHRIWCLWQISGMLLERFVELPGEKRINFERNHTHHIFFIG